MTEPSQNQGTTNRVRVVFPTLDFREASSEQLWELIESTYRVEEQAAAIFAETVAELHRRGGRRLVEEVLRESLGELAQESGGIPPSDRGSPPGLD